MPMEPHIVVRLDEHRPNHAIVTPLEGGKEKEIHLENIFIMPERAYEVDRPADWRFPDDEPTGSPEDLDVRRSPGMMMEDPRPATAPSPQGIGSLE